MPPEELIAAALELKLDAVAVTDHGTTQGAEITRRLGAEAGLLVICGMEVYTNDGDMLVYGISEDIGTVRSASDLIRRVEAQGGAVVAAHPFRGGHGPGATRRGFTPDEVLAQVTAIETHNGGDGAQARMLAEAAAIRLGKPSFGGSDAHRGQDVGRCVTVFQRRIASEEDVVRELRAGRFRGMPLGAARRDRTWYSDTG